MGPQTRFVQVPEGEFKRRKEVVHVVSMHEIDVINSRQQVLALLLGTSVKSSPKCREQIDTKVAEWRKRARRPLFLGSCSSMRCICWTSSASRG